VVAGLALLYGVLIALSPKAALLLAIGSTAMIAVAILAFVAPIAHLFCLLFLTTVIPYSLQHSFSTHPGLLPSDVFLLTGLARAAIVLPRARLGRRRVLTLGLILAFEVIVMVAAIKGFQAGRGLSTVGAEARTLMGFSVAAICMTTLLVEGAERRLMTALLAAGILIGLLGVAEWTLHLSLSDSQDFGVRSGVSFTTGGVGQIQGGLFAFPLAVILCAAALVSREVRTRTGRLTVIAALALNVFSLLVTFERTMWIATALGVVMVVLRAKPARRVTGILWVVLVALASLSALAAISPNTLQTAEQRLLSIGQYQTDDSLRQREVESSHVIQAIKQSPILGSGLAASVFFARPWQQVPSRYYTYTHVGYLWITWRLGIIGAVLLFGLVLLAIGWRGPPPGDPLFASIRGGCQVGLIAMLVMSFTFPPFSGFGITSALGVLIGICAQPRVRVRSDA
jgi:O-antigen ligase